MKVDFERLHWENYPSTDTPINADNLNRLEEGVAGLYSDVSEIQEELGGGVGEYVTEWLDEHVDPTGSAVVVDNTLSITGAAADAKKTGDEISDLKEDLSEQLINTNNAYNGYEVMNNSFVNASINPSNGALQKTFKYRIANEDSLVYPYSVRVKANSGFRFYPYFYNSSGTYVTSAGAWKTDYVINPDTYFKLLIGRTTDITSEIADIAEFLSAITVERVSKADSTYEVNNEKLGDGFSSFTSVFKCGSIDYNSGNFQPTFRYRIANEEFLEYATPVIITAKAGFRIYPYLYDHGGAVTTRAGWSTKYTVDRNTKFRVLIGRTTENTSEVADIKEYLSGITITTSDIVAINKDTETAVMQSARGRASVFGDSAKPLVFLHFSDIHRSLEHWERIVDYINYYSDSISFAVMSGDYVGADQTQYTDLYGTSKPAFIPIFNCVGNHDTYLSNSNPSDVAPQATTKSLLFNDTANWGVTFGTAQNAMYYHKDFSPNNIRLIVIDMYYWDSTEASWLENLLNSAKTNNMTVITVSHEWTSNIVNRVSTFNTLDDYSEVDTFAGRTNYPRPFEPYIKTFKDNGGKHAIHLSGHWHFDNFGFSNTGILNYTIPCAFANEQWTDARRIKGEKSYDCFNIVSVDPVSNLVKIVRIGNNTDNHLQEQNVLVYDYENKTLISNY